SHPTFFVFRFSFFVCKILDKAAALKVYLNPMDKISALVLKVSYEKMGDTAEIEILGKTMLQWVALSLPASAEFRAVPFDGSVELPLLLRPYVDKSSLYTVVLYSDTPLMTKRTVLDAVCALQNDGLNVLKMTRGYIFKTAYLAAAERIYTPDTHYFNEEDFITAFNFKQVSMIGDILRGRILNYHMERGVQIEDAASTFVGPDVIIDAGARIGPFNVIKGASVIKAGATLTAGNLIVDGIVSEGATVDASRVFKSFIGKGTKVGPYAYIRPQTIIGENCRIGDFVEIKASIIGSGCKISHLSYIGDCEMGEGCNIGCGVVFVNYDGKDKHKAKVGNRVFIGSNVNVIAPIVIEDGAFIAAGSTVDKSVPAGALAVARARQENKLAWTGNKFTQSDE
ncbi:MAG: hypothetical protein FWD58_10420, partial [Firmicutes bacterium]|nr:hypothetical protein [Bacillota bacterium]